MIFIAIVIGCILGAVIGIYAPIVPYTYSGYLAIAIIFAVQTKICTAKIKIMRYR